MIAIGTRAYVLVPTPEGADGYLIVFDFADPTRPVEIARWALPFGATGMAVVGNHVFVTHSRTGLYVYDATDVRRPRLATQLPIDADLKQAVAMDHFLLLPAYGELLVVDISVPEQPTQLQGIQFLRIEGVAANRHVAAVTRNPALSVGVLGGVDTVDLADVSEPQLLGTLPMRHGGRSVHWIDDFAILTGYGTDVVDLSSLDAPRLIWTNRVFSTSAAARDGYLYIGAGAGGVYVSRYTSGDGR